MNLGVDYVEGLATTISHTDDDFNMDGQQAIRATPCGNMSTTRNARRHPR